MVCSGKIWLLNPKILYEYFCLSEMVFFRKLLYYCLCFIMENIHMKDEWLQKLQAVCAVAMISCMALNFEVLQIDVLGAQ